MKKKKNIYYFISFVLILGLVGLVVGIAYKVTDGFKNNVSFIITNCNNNLVLNGGIETLKFNSTNSFYVAGLTKNSYQVDVLANDNYYFSVDGETINFNTINYSLNSYFDVNISDVGFTLTPKYYAEDIVKSLYDDAEISKEIPKNSDYFNVKVASGNEICTFKIVYDTPNGIQFSEEGIEF